MKILLILLTILFISACSYISFGKKEKPIIHSGHFLDVKLSKEANEEILKTMENKNYSLVNLTLDDLLIAQKKDIQLEKFPKLIFLNSSIIDLEQDNLYQGKNIMSYYVLNGTCFIGLSDNKLSSELRSQHYLINDYVLAILNIKKESQKENPLHFVLIHRPGKEFENINDRLPEDFKALLTN
jgi:hypothetical protein